MPIGLPNSTPKRVEAEERAEPDGDERQPAHEPGGAGRLGERDAHVVGGLLRVAQRRGERAQALGERRADGRRDPPGGRHVGHASARRTLRSAARRPAAAAAAIASRADAALAARCTRRAASPARARCAPRPRRRDPGLQQHGEPQHGLGGAAGVARARSRRRRHATSSIPSRPAASSTGRPTPASRRMPSGAALDVQHEPDRADRPDARGR